MMLSLRVTVIPSDAMHFDAYLPLCDLILIYQPSPRFSITDYCLNSISIIIITMPVEKNALLLNLKVDLVEKLLQGPLFAT